MRVYRTVFGVCAVLLLIITLLFSLLMMQLESYAYFIMPYFWTTVLGFLKLGIFSSVMVTSWDVFAPGRPFWISHLKIELFMSNFVFSNKIFCRRVPGFATGLCGVWWRGLITRLLFVGILLGNLDLNQSCSVNLTWEKRFSIVLTSLYTYICIYIVGPTERCCTTLDELLK